MQSDGEPLDSARQRPPCNFGLLIKVFGLKLSPGELGAMMQEFDRDGDGTVNCSEFLLTFFRIGFESRNRALQKCVMVSKGIFFSFVASQSIS